MGESFNTATPFGRAVVGILSVFAQLERENIYERTRSGMQKRVELGYWPGGGNLPFGYDYDPVQGVLVPNKDAETVRKIYDLYQQGYSKQVIADMFGLKYDRLVDRILVRKANAGVIVYNGKEYMGRHEAIISLETYEKTMAIMAERSGQRSVSTTDHLLTGLVCCGKCGAKNLFYFGLHRIRTGDRIHHDIYFVHNLPFSQFILPLYGRKYPRKRKRARKRH